MNISWHETQIVALLTFAIFGGRYAWQIWKEYLRAD